MGEKKFQAVALLEWVAQHLLALRMVEEVILRGAAREHVSIVEHVQIGHHASGVLGRGRVDVDDTELGFFRTTELAANRVVADELDADLAIGPFFEIAGEFKTACAFDQQVALVEASGTEFQRVLSLLAEALLIGRFRSTGEAGKRYRAAQTACGQKRGCQAITPCDAKKSRRDRLFNVSDSFIFLSLAKKFINGT